MYSHLRESCREKNFRKYKNIIEKIIIFFLIVNFNCASRSANLREKALIQTSKQAGLSRIDQIYFREALKKLVFF